MDASAYEKWVRLTWLLESWEFRHSGVLKANDPCYFELHCVSFYLKLEALSPVKTQILWEGHYEFSVAEFQILFRRLYWEGRKNHVEPAGRVVLGDKFWKFYILK